MRLSELVTLGLFNIPCNIDLFSGISRTPKKKSKKTHQTPQLHVNIHFTYAIHSCMIARY